MKKLIMFLIVIVLCDIGVKIISAQNKRLASNYVADVEGQRIYQFGTDEYTCLAAHYLNPRLEALVSAMSCFKN